MKILPGAMVAAVALIGAALAHTIPGGVPGIVAKASPQPALGSAVSRAASVSTMPPAISMSNAESKTPAAPVPGANSFTEAEARHRLEAYGYTNISGLQKDSQSIWRGTAMKDGRPVQIALDYQGNIVARQGQGQ
jgi:hypothetical protein